LKVMGNYRANAANSSTDRSRGQLFAAYRNGRVDGAVSLGFLLCWIGGDLTNFKGCYLTNQLPFQVNLSPDLSSKERRFWVMCAWRASCVGLINLANKIEDIQ
uniref:Solute carrier family 66 member 1 like n=1 Tax=Cebus imitator TaxID=2715852 RepID=A0A2K5P8P4_CEBIM